MFSMLSTRKQRKMKKSPPPGEFNLCLEEHGTDIIQPKLDIANENASGIDVMLL